MFELTEPAKQIRVLAEYRLDPGAKDVSQLEAKITKESQHALRTPYQIELTAQQTDLFGYTYDDTADYSWVRANSGGSPGPDKDDGYGGPYDLGFTFEFYGIEYDEFYIGTNGFITFGSGSSNRFNRPIPYPTEPNNIIAPFWDDLDPSASGQIYYRTYGSAPNRYTVVEWYQVPRYGTEDKLTFEVTLYEGSNDIKFQYQSLSGNLGWATVGIEDSYGEIGLQYLYNNPSLAEGVAILFEYPDPKAGVFVTPRYHGGFLSPGESVSLDQSIRNIGLLGTDTFNLEAESNWTTRFYGPDNSIPLTDTNGDSYVDTGSIPQNTAGTFYARMEAPTSADAGGHSMATITSSSSRDSSVMYQTYGAAAVPAPFAQVYVQDYAPDGTSDNEVYVDLIRPTSQETIQITDDDEWVYRPSITSQPQGGYLITWNRPYRNRNNVNVDDIEYAVLDSHGQITRAVTKLTDHSTATGRRSDFNAVGAVAPSGNTLIAWTRYDGTTYNVYYAVTSANGSLVRPPTALTQNRDDPYPRDWTPRVAVLENNRFVIAWENRWRVDENSATVSDIYYTVLDDIGTVIHEPANLTQNSGDYDDWDPYVAAVNGNEILLVWEDEYYNTSTTGAAAALLNSSGQVIQSERIITTEDDGYVSGPKGRQLHDGRFLLAWSSLENAEYQVRYATLNPNLNLVDGPHLIRNNASPGNYWVSIVGDAADRTILTWLDGDMEKDIYYAVVDAYGDIRTPAMVYRKANETSIWSNWQGYGSMPLQDNTPPSFSTTISPTGWVRDQTPDITIQVSDGTSGLDVDTAKYAYSTDGGASWNSWTAATTTGGTGTIQPQTISAHNIPFHQDSRNQNRVSFRIADAAGNVRESPAQVVKVDSTPPVSSASSPPEVSSSSFTVQWSGTDATSEIHHYRVQFKVGNGTWQDWLTTSATSATFGPATPVSVQPGRTYYFRTQAYDVAGNAEPYPPRNGDTATRVRGGEATTACLPLVLVNFASVPCRDAYEPNNSSGEATPLTPGQGIQALICPTNDRDIFALDVNTLDPIVVEMTGMVTETNFDMWLYDPDGEALCGSTNRGNANERIECTPTQAGRHYLMVFRPEAAPMNTGPYFLIWREPG